MRIEPPPSLAWANGVTPAATSAAEPPDEPPVERVRSHGLRVAPLSRLSVVGVIPNSGIVDFPSGVAPSATICFAHGMEEALGRSVTARDPWRVGSPAHASLSLMKVGMPRNGRSAASDSGAGSGTQSTTALT